MTFVELPVAPIYWHFPRTIKGYQGSHISHSRSIIYIYMTKNISRKITKLSNKRTNQL